MSAVPAREMKLFEPQLCRKRRLFTDVLFLDITWKVACLIVASGRQVCFPVKGMVPSAHLRPFLVSLDSLSVKGQKTASHFSLFIKQNTIEVL